MKKLVPVFALALFLMLAVSARAFGGVHYYSTALNTLNASGVTGSANLVLDGDQLTVHISASGLEANKTHPQHIHGFADDSNSKCPPAAADTDGDGIITFLEGLPFYGPVQLSLMPFQTAPTNTIFYNQTFTINPEALGPLQNRTIVLHGLTVNGTYVPSMPVACGPIRQFSGK